jgi:hypothetical protein
MEGSIIYQNLKEQCEAGVTRWEWGTAFLHELRPFYAERAGFTPGKWLPKEPRKKKGKRQYGLDDSGRLVVERQHTSFEGKINETFYVYSNTGDFAEATRYEHFDKTHGTVSKYEYEQGRLVKWAHTIRSKTSMETYTYEGARLIRSVYIEGEGDPRMPTVESRTRTFEYLYNDHGRLERIEESHHGGQRSVIYQRAEADLSPMLRQFESILIETIPQTVKGLHLDEKAYCVGLVYSDDYYLLPPELAVGLDRQRQEWLKEERDGVERILWSVEDYELFDSGSEVGRYAEKRNQLRLRHKVLGKLGIDIAHHLRATGSVAPARQLLVALAKKLNKLEWSEIMPVTDDFIVLPLSTEGGYDPAEIKECVPAARRRVLEKKGYIP